MSISPKKIICTCPEISPMCRLGVGYRKEGCLLDGPRDSYWEAPNVVVVEDDTTVPWETNAEPQVPVQEAGGQDVGRLRAAELPEAPAAPKAEKKPQKRDKAAYNAYMRRYMGEYRAKKKANAA